MSVHMAIPLFRPALHVDAKTFLVVGNQIQPLFRQTSHAGVYCVCTELVVCKLGTSPLSLAIWNTTHCDLIYSW